MEQRDVSRENIRDTIDSPTSKGPTINSVQEFRKNFGNRILVVHAEIRGNDRIIVSTWWDNERDERFKN